MRTRTRGIVAEKDGGKIINKQYKGQRIFARLGTVSQDEAEKYLRAEQNRIDVELRAGTKHLFCDAAKRYLIECEHRKVKTLENIAIHVGLVLPYIGSLPLHTVHTGSLQKFCNERIASGVSPSTVNYALTFVRTILNRAARVWRNDDGTPWLGSSPKIELLKSNPRKPYPLSWAEQTRLFKELPTHLERMALFAVNTGLREQNICLLRWDWERRIPELKRSVFVIPASEYKSDRNHVVILNDVAMGIIESMRGKHDEFVFPYHGQGKRKELGPIAKMNNSAWKHARKSAGLTQVRVHDLRHTYGQRLRDAGVSEEDRAVLLGHSTQSMPRHYATPTIARLVDMANLANKTRDTPTLLRVSRG